VVDTSKNSGILWELLKYFQFSNRGIRWEKVTIIAKSGIKWEKFRLNDNLTYIYGYSRSLAVD